MTVAVVGVHDPHLALPQEPGKAQRLGQHEANVVPETGAVEKAFAGRRLEANAEFLKQVRKRTFELMQQDHWLVAPSIEALDQLRRREVAAADKAASEGEGDDHRGGWSPARAARLRHRTPRRLPCHDSRDGLGRSGRHRPACHRHSHACPCDG
jgi:hypothetical protein